MAALAFVAAHQGHEEAVRVLAELRVSLQTLDQNGV